MSCLVRATSRVDELRAAGAQLIACDIADRTGVARAIASSNPRFVFHLAGLVRAMDPGDFIRVNAKGVEAVAEACTDQPDRPVLVLVSSIAAAGPSGERPAVESDPPVPVSYYGRSKFAGEQVAMRYADALPITVVRPCVVFGAGDRGMYEVFRPIARSGLHVVGGSGDRRVSLVAVADLVECLVLAAEQGERLAPGVSGHGIYFAAAEDISYVELGKAIARALGKPQPRILRLPGWSMRTSAGSAMSCRGSAGARGGSGATRSATFSQVRGRARRRKPGSNWAGCRRPRSPIAFVKLRSGTATRTGFDRPPCAQPSTALSPPHQPGLTASGRRCDRSWSASFLAA